MAKFCTKCGKELEEGKKCTCEKEIVKNVENSDFVGLLKGFVEIVKSFLKKPIDTLKENVSDSKFNISLVAIAAYGIAMGLFMIVLFKEIFGSLSTLLLFGGFGDLGGLGTVDIPYFKTFVIGFALAVVFIALMALVAYVIADKLLKGKTSIKKMFTLFGFASIITTVTLLVSTICLFIDIRLGIVVLVAGSALNTYYNFKGLEFATKTDINKLGYVLMPTTLIVSFIVGFVIPKIFS